MSKNNRVPVLRGSRGASWRRQNTSSSPTQLGFPESAALPNAASVCAPACPALLPGSAPPGRTHSHPRKNWVMGWGGVEGEGGGFTLVIPRLVDFSDSCWSGRGQIRRRWHREIPGIPVFVVRNVALISAQTDDAAAETRIALQADGADGSWAEFLVNTYIFWTRAVYAVCSI